MPKDYLVWDLETSGLDHKTCHVLEFGAIEVKDGEVIAEHNFLINHGIEIPQVITEITGITKEMVDKDGIEPSAAFGTIYDLFAKYGTHVTHNGLKFDIPFIVSSFERNVASKDANLGEAVAVAYEKYGPNYMEELRSKAVDTAVFCKAKKIDMPRKDGESFAEWGDRVMAVKAFGVKYNVGLMCEELGIDKTGFTQHRAMGDVYLTNEILKKVAA